MQNKNPKSSENNQFTLFFSRVFLCGSITTRPYCLRGQDNVILILLSEVLDLCEDTLIDFEIIIITQLRLLTS